MTSGPTPPGRPNPFLSPTAIAGVYVLLGAAWITFSDVLVEQLFGGLPPHVLTQVQTVKGLVYVLITAVLLYILIRQSHASVQRAEERRLASESRFRQLFEKTTAVALLVDVDSGQILDANAAASRFYGWTRAELLAKRVTELNTLPPEEVTALLAKAASEEQSIFRFRHRTASGEIRDVEIHSTPLETAGRQSLFSLVYDVTERLRAERAVEESRGEYRLLLEDAAEAIFISSPSGQLLDCSHRACDLLGYPKEELLQVELERLIDPDDLASAPLRIADLRAGQTVLAQRQMVRKDGTRVHVELVAKTLKDGRLQAIVRDLSPRRDLEDQLRQSQKMEAVGQLTGGIAHDLNNMLTVVLTNAELVAQTLPADRGDLQAPLEDLRAAARRGSTMIRKLLGFSRKAPLAFSTLDLVKVVDEVTATLRRMLPAHIEIVTAHEGGRLPVRGDAGAIEQILLNLATNARDAMPNGGRLRIETRRGGDHRAEGSALLVVSDTGHGMDDMTRTRVFEPFYTTKLPGEGTGLGLAMVYGLVQQHGGFIDVDSAPGAGTTMRVHFPLVSPDEFAPAPAAGPAVLRGGSETILLVEDEEALRRVAQRLLERLGYTVLTAGDGLDALELFEAERHRIALIVTDLVMPRLGGRALYEVLRRRGHRVKMLFTSGYGWNEFEGGSAVGAEVQLLQKPWSPDEFAGKLREILDAT